MEHASDIRVLEGFLYVREVADVSTYKLDAFWNGLSRAAEVKQKYVESLLIKSTA